MLTPDDRGVGWHVGKDVRVLAISVKARVRLTPARTNERLANIVDDAELEICDRPRHERQYRNDIDTNDQDHQYGQQPERHESLSKGSQQLVHPGPRHIVPSTFSD